MAMAGLYRRTLPSPPAIDFASSEGKKIFTEALQKGTMEGFFRLISYFQTQSEPAYCGLASVSMVLNALSIDPGRKWKGPWRWFDESMLDCCEPLEKVKAKGISFGKVVCLAHCAGAKVEAFRTSQSTLHDFRNYVMTCSTSDNCHVISSYHRGVFKQTGTGHFSPIGGYNAERDMALILDVARFKYPPHWVPLKLLWEAMDTLDETTGQRRGFLLISRPHREPGLLYTLSCKHESWRSIAKYLTNEVPRLVSSQHVTDVEKVISVVYKSMPSKFNEFIKWIAEVRRKEDVNQSISSEEKARLALKEEVLAQVQETDLYKHISQFLFSVGQEDSLPCVAAKACCQAAGILSGNSSVELCCCGTCVKCIKDSRGEAVRVVSGTVLNGTGREEEVVDLIVPSSSVPAQGDPKCCGCKPGGSAEPEVYQAPAGYDVLTVLLLALPPQTWSDIRDQNLVPRMKNLVSMVSLPTLLQEEVLHLRRQLRLLKRCQEDKEDEELGAPLF